MESICGNLFCQRIRQGVVVAVFLLSVACSSIRAQEQGPLQEAISKIQSVGAAGAGHSDAVPALRILSQASPVQIPEILDGMDGASPLVANWFRGAVNSVASRADKLPVTKLRAYFDDLNRSSLGRLLAFDLLKQADGSWADEQLPKLLDDPSLPLRARAVKWWIEKSESAAGMESVGILATVLNKARDIGQVQDIANRLATKGVPIDLKKRLGFIDSWYFVGRFDNKEGKGFDVAYGPEVKPAIVDFEAEFESVDGAAKWQERQTNDGVGVFDLTQFVGKYKGETVYAAAIFKSAESVDAEIRIGTPNAHKIYLNGKLVMSNEVYHNSNSADKFSASCQLKKGDNYILVKLCQNEQTESWAQDWSFQLRVCDASGTPIETIQPKTSRN